MSNNLGTSFKHIGLGLVAILLGCLNSPQADAQEYSLTEVGNHYSAAAFNDLGQVVGTEGLQSYLWSNGATTAITGFAGTSIVTAADINNAGQVTGTMNVPSTGGATTNHAYRWFQGATQDLDPGGVASTGNAINAAGLVAGTVTPAVQDQFRIGSAIFNGSTVQVLPVPPDVNGTSSANAINDKGEVAGTGGGASGRFEPYFYTAGVATPLGNLGGQIGRGLGINNSGTVVGSADTLDFTERAFVYKGGLKTSLDPASAFDATFANAINDAGKIVGNGFEKDGASFAFVVAGGLIANLNSLLDASGNGWHLTSAVDVNGLGDILALGHDQEGVEHAVILAPVPEPATLLMMAVGLLSLCAKPLSRRLNQPIPLLVRPASFGQHAHER